MCLAKIASLAAACFRAVMANLWHACQRWHAQPVAYAENFHGGFHSVAYGGHLCLVCAVYDVTIRRHIHVSQPTFWRSLLT